MILDGILPFGWMPSFYSITTTMRHILLKSRWSILVLLVFLLAGCSSRREVFFRTVSNRSSNSGIKLIYSYDAYQWQPVDSLLKVPVVGDGSIKDPSIIRDKGLYHVVWVAVKDGKEGLVHTTTSNFKTWSPAVFIRVVTADSTQLAVSTPRLFFDEQTDTCLVYWSSESGGRECVYSLKTTDFKSFTPAKKLYDPGFSIQDPCLVCREPNDYVLVFKDHTPLESNLKVAFSDRLDGPYDRLSPSFSAFQTRRPSVTKIGAKWFIYCEDYGNNRMTVVSTLDFDSFEDISEEMDLPFHTDGGDIFLMPRTLFGNVFRHLHCKPVKEKK